MTCADLAALRMESVEMNDPGAKKLSPRRQRTRAAKFREIRKRAMDLIQTEGVDGLTIQRLADELDWAPGTLYRYYRSKDALLEDLQIEIVRAIDTRVRERSESFIASSPPERELGLIIVAALAYADFAVEQPAQFRLLCLSIGDPEPLLTDDALARQSMAALLEPVRGVANLLGAAADAGILEPGDEMARALLLWLSVHAVAMTRKLARLDPALDTDALVLEAIATALRGFGAEPARLGPAFNQVTAWRAR